MAAVAQQLHNREHRAMHKPCGLLKVQAEGRGLNHFYNFTYKRTGELILTCVMERLASSYDDKEMCEMHIQKHFQKHTAPTSLTALVMLL